MEAQLSAYRSKKARERQANSGSYSLFKWFRRNKEEIPVELHKQTKSLVEKHDVKPSSAKVVPTVASPISYREQYFDEAGTSGYTSSQHNNRLILFLKILLWLIIWGLFVEIGFGAVYFVLSILLFVYFNTRTGPKRGDGPSAYSVFNPNCERLDGTITAEQFESELRYGALSVN